MTSKNALYDVIDDLRDELAHKEAMLAREQNAPKAVAAPSEDKIPSNVAIAVETVALMLEDKANSMAIRKGGDITSYEEMAIAVHDLRSWLAPYVRGGTYYGEPQMDVDLVNEEANKLWEVLSS